MKKKMPANEALRNKDGVIDQRKQQIDPAGKHRIDVNKNAKRSQKQPGQELRDPQKDTDDAEKHAKEKRTPPEKRHNAKGDHEGSAHTPDEFDAVSSK